VDILGRKQTNVMNLSEFEGTFRRSSTKYRTSMASLIWFTVDRSIKGIHKRFYL